MGSMNTAFVMGRLGKNPEVRQTKDGKSVANFSLATDESFKNSIGERIQKTEWHQIVAWGNLAQFAEKYLAKGRQVLIQGRLQTSEWTDKDSVKRYRTEIVAQRIQFADAKPAANQPDGEPETEATPDTAPF